MSTKTPKLDAPTATDAPLVAPLLQVSKSILEALIAVREALQEPDPTNLIRQAAEVASQHGLVWRVCENAAPQVIGDMVVFQFRVDLLHTKGDIMYAYDVMNVPVSQHVGGLLTIAAREIAHHTFIRSLFGYLTDPVTSPAPIAAPQVPSTQTPGLVAASEPAATAPAPEPEPEEERDRSYLIAQTTPDGIPVLVDLWEASDQNKNPEAISSDAVHILCEYADTAPAVGQLNAAWQQNAAQVEFIRDYDHAEFDNLVESFDRNMNRIQEAPQKPKNTSGRRRRRE